MQPSSFFCIICKKPSTCMFLNHFLCHLHRPPVPLIPREHTGRFSFLSFFNKHLTAVFFHLRWSSSSFRSFKSLSSYGGLLWHTPLDDVSFPPECDFLHWGINLNTLTGRFALVSCKSCMNDIVPAVWSSVSPPHLPGLGSGNIALKTSYWYLSWWALTHSRPGIIGWGSIRLMEMGT